MTEAGKKWVEEHWVSGASEGTKGVLFPGAEFWLRAFCDEVEKLATDKFYNQGLDAWEDALSEAFDQLKRELLGQ